MLQGTSKTQPAAQKRFREMGTGGSASNKRPSSSDAVGEKSNEDIIRELQAEIKRLKSDTSKATKY